MNKGELVEKHGVRFVIGKFRDRQKWCLLWITVDPIAVKHQNFYSWQRAVEYMNYLTKSRDYDWKTIHK